MSAEVCAAEVCAPELPRMEHPSSLVRELARRVSELVAKAGEKVRHTRCVGALLEALAGFVDGRGWCFCSLETLAARTRFSVRHLQRAVLQAEAAGLLVRAVPRVGARLLGTATEYLLPWWSRSPGAAVGGALAVLSAKRKGPVVPSLTREVVRSVLGAVERVAPLELARRVAAQVGGSLGFNVMREASRRASLLEAEGGALGAPPLRTPRPNKIPSKRTLGESEARSRGGEGSDRGAERPAGGEAGFAARLRAASERALGAVEARDARTGGGRPPEIT